MPSIWNKFKVLRLHSSFFCFHPALQQLWKRDTCTTSSAHLRLCVRVDGVILGQSSSGPRGIAAGHAAPIHSATCCSPLRCCTSFNTNVLRDPQMCSVITLWLQNGLWVNSVVLFGGYTKAVMGFQKPLALSGGYHWVQESTRRGRSALCRPSRWQRERKSSLSSVQVITPSHCFKQKYILLFQTVRFW